MWECRKDVIGVKALALDCQGEMTISINFGLCEVICANIRGGALREWETSLRLLNQLREKKGTERLNSVFKWCWYF